MSADKTYQKNSPSGGWGATIAFDAKRYYHNKTGLGNYSRTLVSDLQRLFPDNEYVLYDEKTFSRLFRMGHKAVADGCQLFHGLSNELPMDSRCVPATIVTMHDVAWLTFPDMYHTFDRKIYDFKYGRSCRRADKVVAISESTKRDVMRFYGVPESRIEVIYQPVQHYYYDPMTHEEAVKLINEHFNSQQSKHINSSSPWGRLGGASYILYVGSINSRKNLLSAVKALAMLPKENRPLLLCIGDGHEYRREVEQYIAQNNLADDVRIENGIHNNRLLQALYREAKAFVYPSFYEGFGLPVVEAALQQTPVITTTVSSLPEAAGPSACLIDPHATDAPEQIAYHIDHILSDTEYARTTALALEQYARTSFDPDTLTRQMMHLYESMI